MPFPIPPLPSPTYQAAYAILGHHIYVIGGILSQQVWILDCRINRWRQGPSMLIPRVSASTAVADGKIYVMGGRGRQLPDIWGEVLDPAVGRWVEADYNCLNSSSGDGTEFKKNRACFTDGFFYTLEYPDKLVGHELGDMEESVEYWGKPWAVKGLLDLPMWYSIGTRRRPKQLAGSGSNGRSLFLVWIHYWNQQYELWCSQLDLNNTKRGDDWQLSATPSSSHKIFSSFDQFTIGGSLVVHDL
ncbi:F-box/kelch-repeat protein SKIP6-like [Arachis duranensis]|uniref:F-box/kelch-repeat protein SKIP6-like n=1 Tax=Arachis duranensis TaxID=130453 RepID=A0A9C6TM44_ARADU|nr:F-box/kelch-repeat protein SKIP6-like [Arachis duranensis]